MLSVYSALAGRYFYWVSRLWFLLLACAGLSRIPDRRFQLNWWSMAFPNVGFTVATLRDGEAVESSGLVCFALVMAIALLILWVGVLTLCARAVLMRIIYHRKDENI